LLTPDKKTGQWADGNRLGAVSTNGTFVALNKFEKRELFDFKFHGAVVGGTGQHGPIAYVPSIDTILYALDMNNGRLLWRFFAGPACPSNVDATARDIFVTPDSEGMICLDRETGRQPWQNNVAQRFLSTNYKFVYAVDRLGELLILDYNKGTSLAKWCTSEYVV